MAYIHVEGGFDSLQVYDDCEKVKPVIATHRTPVRFWPQSLDNWITYDFGGMETSPHIDLW